MIKHIIRGLNVVEFGEGNQFSIIFVHAFPLCNRMWDYSFLHFQVKEYF